MIVCQSNRPAQVRGTKLLAEDAAVLDRRPTRDAILGSTLMSPKGRH